MDPTQILKALFSDEEQDIEPGGTNDDNKAQDNVTPQTINRTQQLLQSDATVKKSPVKETGVTIPVNPQKQKIIPWSVFRKLQNYDCDCATLCTGGVCANQQFFSGDSLTYNNRIKKSRNRNYDVFASFGPIQKRKKVN